MRKVYIDVTVRIVAQIDESVEVSDFMGEIDYNFIDTTGKGEVEDTEITNWTIKDSK